MTAPISAVSSLPFRRDNNVMPLASLVEILGLIRCVISAYYASQFHFLYGDKLTARLAGRLVISH